MDEESRIAMKGELEVKAGSEIGVGVNYGDIWKTTLAIALTIDKK